MLGGLHSPCAQGEVKCVVGCVCKAAVFPHQRHQELISSTNKHFKRIWKQM